MDIYSVAALPVTAPGSPGVGSPDSFQATSVVSGPVSSRADPSGSVLSKAAASGMDISHESPSSDSLARAVKQVNDAFDQKGQGLYASFEKDQMTGISVIKIIDKKTKETISQMPPREMVAFAQFLEHPQGVRGQLIHATA